MITEPEISCRRGRALPRLVAPAGASGRRFPVRPGEGGGFPGRFPERNRPSGCFVCWGEGWFGSRWLIAAFPAGGF
ncbi:hypothetical protein A6M21_00825 [Desulfotomaculum copahuensis]|uniref:Uncharacterized protein n=1 Tax=Desulfotomaculum copahuensis TaxID=1838280 RepID=A0A1B7LBW9_9FIRM|nr:hypothetical protein A6M21_00825 [Desulfotomaculum copahuensis]